jgi:membrane glycosyltransferase
MRFRSFEFRLLTDTIKKGETMATKRILTRGVRMFLTLAFIALVAAAFYAASEILKSGKATRTDALIILAALFACVAKLYHHSIRNEVAKMEVTEKFQHQAAALRWPKIRGERYNEDSRPN